VILWNKRHMEYFQKSLTAFFFPPLKSETTVV
jgi:hypothetical protein